MSEVRKRRTLKRIKIEKRRGSKAIESGLILIAQFNRARNAGATQSHPAAMIR